MPTDPNQPLRFDDETAVVAYVDQLRGGWKKAGNWSLPQTCWHLTRAIEMSLGPSEDDPDPEHPGRKMLLGILEAGGPPPGFQTPPELDPDADLSDAEIDRLIAALEKLKTVRHERVDMGPFGPATTDECRRFHLIHCRHHLSRLTPAE